MLSKLRLERRIKRRSCTCSFASVSVHVRTCVNTCAQVYPHHEARQNTGDVGLALLRLCERWIRAIVVHRGFKTIRRRVRLLGRTRVSPGAGVSNSGYPSFFLSPSTVDYLAEIVKLSHGHYLAIDIVQTGLADWQVKSSAKRS